MPWPLLVATVATAAGSAVLVRAGAEAADPPWLEQFTETIPRTAVSFEMVPVPGGSAASADGGATEVAPFWISRTEMTWNAYDLYLYGFDAAPPGEDQPDAVARPSKPYISMDRGFGHSGYPAISISYHGAEAFCAWLSANTGRHYRLPTEAEWRHACALGAVDREWLGRYAWYAQNAGDKTHAVAGKAPDALGLCDMYGNAAEWCRSADGAGVTLGGSYRDDVDGIGCAARVPPRDAWNASDPQFPQSVWWLADAGFVGFRVVCEPGLPPGEKP
jgi:formylglycine-generating enzyme required for sulfatase activity